MRVPKEDWDFLNEKAFEDALQASVPERLPDKVAVTPWKRAMGRVLAGTALTALGTNLWGLNYLLPGIGLVLMLLGFRLLRREEIDACRGAIQAVVSVQEFDQEGGFCRSSGSNPLCITGVGAKLTGEPAGWMIFRHFLWNTAPPFHGTAAIQLWPVYQSDELWSAAGEVAGRVLYDRGGETFWAPYHSLEEDTSPYGYQGIYGQRDIFGTFSLSTAAQHGRGYVVYAADEIPHAEYRNVLDSRFHYSYPHRFLQYPAKTALENRMSDHGAFRTVWSDLRYGPEVTPPVIKKNDQLGTVPHLVRRPIWQGVPLGRVHHLAGHLIEQGVPTGTQSKAFQPAHTVRKDLPIRGWQRYGRTCGRLAAATDCPMRRKRSSGSSTSSGS